MIHHIAAIAFPLKSLSTRCGSIFVSLSACVWSRTAGGTRDYCLAPNGPAVGREIRARLASEIRRGSAGRLGDKWHLGEAVVSTRGKKHWLWRAVDQGGFVLEALVKSRRNAKAAKCLIRKLLKGQGRAPQVMITDKLRSYDAPNPGSARCRIRPRHLPVRLERMLQQPA